METYQIGDKINWKVGGIESSGVVLDDNGGDTLTVITHLVAGRVDNRQIELQREVIVKNGL